MARLLIHVEGQTEEGFVNEVLRNYLAAKGYHSVEARIVGNARLRLRRGGIRPWHSVRTDIMNHLLEDQGCIATTMVDYYALPQKGPGEWPGRANSTRLATVADKAQCVETALHDDLVAEMGGRFDSRSLLKNPANEAFLLTQSNFLKRIRLGNPSGTAPRSAQPGRSSGF